MNIHYDEVDIKIEPALANWLKDALGIYAHFLEEKYEKMTKNTNDSGLKYLDTTLYQQQIEKINLVIEKLQPAIKIFWDELKRNRLHMQRAKYVIGV